MNSQIVSAVVVAENSNETVKAGGDQCIPTETPIQNLGLDELLDYKPVPPRRVVSINARYRRQGRCRPLPYLLDEAGCE
jgi:hypothetical protein